MIAGRRAARYPRDANETGAWQKPERVTATNVLMDSSPDVYVGTDPWEGQGHLFLQPHRGHLVGATVGGN